jgi:hypothetical protein
VAPLRLGGLRGKESTPSIWLGGTGEFFVVGKEAHQGHQTGAGRAGQGMLCILMEWMCLYLMNAFSYDKD